MIQGSLFDLKETKRWKALKERLLFIATDWYTWLIVGIMVYGFFLLNISTKLEELITGLG